MNPLETILNIPLRRLWTCLAAAAAIAFLTGAPAPAAPQGEDTPVTVRAVPQHPAVEQGGKLVIAVEMNHQPHFHTWPAKEVKLPDNIDEFAIRTEVGPQIDEKATDAAKEAATKAKKPEAEVAATRVYALPSWARFDGTQYPATKTGKVADPTGANPTISLPLYEGKAVSYIRIEIRPDAPIGDQEISVLVSFQSCNEQMCTPPQDLPIQVKFKIVKKGAADAALTAESEAALFAAFDAKKWGSGGAAPPAPKPEAKPEAKPTKSSANSTPLVPISPAPIAGKITPNPAAAAAAPPGGATLFGMDIGTNIFVLALASMLGGFILNLTPCVLPVIPIKVMSLTQHATSRAHALVLGLWMAAGVVAFWAAVGLPMAIISRQLDPSQYIFGTWWVCLLIGIVVALLGLGIMGLFTLNLPQSVYMVETKADSPMGAFLFGVLAAVLGLPCFGFMAGGLLAAASTLPAVSIMTIFVCLGIGMAAPYLVLSVWPQLLKFIPRTGPASELVKQVLGILMIAAAAFFVTAGIQVLLKEYPYLAGSMVWWAVGFFIAIASLWLIVRAWQITPSLARRAVFTMLAIAMTGGIWVFAQDRLQSDRTAFEKRELAMQEAAKHHTITAAETPEGVWLEYTPELFASVRASGRPIFLDFTASWCITCKAIKAGVLDREPLATEFKKRGIVLMEVDCSARNSAGSRFLRELNRTGVPTWALYVPGSDTPRIVPVDKPTSDSVLAALDAAGLTAAVTTTSSAAPSDPPKPPH